MPLIEITSLAHPGIEIFSALTEAQLRNRLEPGKGIFIAESPKVIRVALEAGYTPVALLCERKHITGDAADIIARCGDIPLYTGERLKTRHYRAVHVRNPGITEQPIWRHFTANDPESHIFKHKPCRSIHRSVLVAMARARFMLCSMVRSSSAVSALSFM